MEGWPPDGLEPVPACPACGASVRLTLYEGLRDRVFAVAPGSWTLYSCRGCGAAYLDPRPTRESIGLAYRNYVTADAPAAPDGATSRSSSVGLLRHKLRNGYVNGRYGYALSPATSVGRFVLPLFPRKRETADMYWRHLPKQATLLDAGCGNGDFLLRMARAGWHVQGLEPDLVAADVARAAGIAVAASPLESADIGSNEFDAITMSHVIEHLHDPVSVLASCHRALVPNGLLWITTPNLDSYGRRIFASDWIHLDPPRHLVVFDRRALSQLLARSGFAPRRWFTHRTAEFSFANSAALARNDRPFGEGPLTGGQRLRARAANALTVVSRGRSEELIVLAQRV